jgi:hypothetical protein
MFRQKFYKFGGVGALFRRQLSPFLAGLGRLVKVRCETAARAHGVQVTLAKKPRRFAFYFTIRLNPGLV